MEDNGTFGNGPRKLSMCFAYLALDFDYPLQKHGKLFVDFAPYIGLIVSY